MGGLLWCLKKCLIDLEIISMKNIEIYEPEDNSKISNDKTSTEKKRLTQKYMVIDSITLNNLEVVKNSTDGSTSGTLFERLDYCNSGFGK
jgi:DNA mismatch repair protein MSH6